MLKISQTHTHVHPQIIWLSCGCKKSQINQIYESRNKVSNRKIWYEQIILKLIIILKIKILHVSKFQMKLQLKTTETKEKMMKCIQKSVLIHHQWEKSQQFSMRIRDISQKCHCFQRYITSLKRNSERLFKLQP